jgi:single-strand DNA-binding protein
MKGNFMAKGINKIFLLGNVGRDPEIKATAGGVVLASFSLATADRAKDAQGNWKDSTEWHNIIAFGRLAEVVRDHVEKGSQLHVEGKIQTRSWDDKQSGQKKYRTEIIVGELTLLGSITNPAQNSKKTTKTDYAEQVNSSSGELGKKVDDGTYITDDDIPF